MGCALTGLAALLLAATAPAAAAAAEPDGPSVTLDCPERVTIGDSCRLIVELAAAPGDRVELPEQASEPGAAVEIVGPQLTRPPSRPTRVRAGFDLHLWATGEVAVPALALRVVPADGPPREVPVPEQKIQVIALLPGGEQQARPLKDPVDLLVPRYWPLAVLGAVLLAALALLRWRLARRRSAGAEPEEPLADHELARSRLEELRGAELVAAGRAGEHFNRVAWILREYIEARFRLARPPVEPGALQRTRRELIEGISQRPRIAPHADLLDGVLGQCDRVRFGKRTVQPDEAEHHLDRALQFVRVTQPSEAPAPVSSARGGGAG